MSASSPRVAIVYDRLNSQGGAEVVLRSLLSLYPSAVLVSSVVDVQGAPWLSELSHQVRTSWLQRVPGLAKRHRLLGWLMPFVFESIDLHEFGLIVSVSSEAAKAVLTRPEQLHVCYLLTPTRYLWSHASEYERAVPWFLRPFWRQVRRFLRAWDKTAAQRPDVLVALSPNIAKRCEQYYGRLPDAVLYPPVEPLPPAAVPAYVPPKPFFFSWGRLVPYKRFDVLFAAAQQAGVCLVVAGEGPDKSRLQRLLEQNESSGSVLLDRVPSEHIRWYVEHAQAAVFPQQEDFGLVVVESLLAGCPVLLHEASGSAALVRPGKDGVLLQEQTINPEKLSQILANFSSKKFDRLDIARQAVQYSGMQFLPQWEKLMQQFQADHQRLLQ